MNEETRECRICGKVKPIDEFPFCKGALRKYQCRECKAKYDRNRYAKKRLAKGLHLASAHARTARLLPSLEKKLSKQAGAAKHFASRDNNGYRLLEQDMAQKDTDPTVFRNGSRSARRSHRPNAEGIKARKEYGQEDPIELPSCLSRRQAIDLLSNASCGD